MARRSDPEERPAARALLDYLNRPAYRPMVQRELIHRVNVPKEERPAVRRLIRRLVERGRIHKIRGGKLVAAPPEDGLRGVLQRHVEGFGFVVPEGGGEDVFIPPRHLGEGLSGDRVAVRITRRGRDGRLHGVVTEILEGHGRELLGVFHERDRGGVVQPFDPSRGEEIRVPAPFRMGARELEAVRVELLEPAVAGRPAKGKVLERLGHLDDPGTDVRVVSEKYGLVPEFPAEVLEEAEGLPQRIGRVESKERIRFDDPSPVTIDGETAQDFDDAVAVAELPRGGFRLWVHIADVSHFVTTASELDREACRRGTSVYFPGKVVPMLPERLSNGLCSLRPGEDRLVQTAILDFTAKGERRQVRFADGLIRSAARLTYTQVAAVLDGKKRVAGVPAGLMPMLKAANRLRRLLERRRHARGSIDFDLPEPQILLDVEGVMTGITIEPRNRAHRLIEEFMLAANEAVADHLEQRERACMFRVHEPPDPTRVEALAEFVKAFGLELRTSDGAIEPAAIQRLVEQADGRPEERVIGQVALRAMMQARYSAENTGHFGLASPSYCHFTSPIRRYPDLIVHRQLRALRRSAAEPLPGRGLVAVAETSSELERNAEAAERELLVWKKVAFIEDRVGESFDGVVTGVTRFGLFVQLVENLVEGLLRVERLGPEWFEFVESRLELRGADSGRAYRLGDRLRVRVERADRVRQRVDFSLIEPGPACGEKRRKARNGRRASGRRYKNRARRSRSSGQRR